MHFSHRHYHVLPFAAHRAECKNTNSNVYKLKWEHLSRLRLIVWNFINFFYLFSFGFSFFNKFMAFLVSHHQTKNTIKILKSIHTNMLLLKRKNMNSIITELSARWRCAFYFINNFLPDHVDPSIWCQS